MVVTIINIIVAIIAFSSAILSITMMYKENETRKFIFSIPEKICRVKEGFIDLWREKEMSEEKSRKDK